MTLENTKYCIMHANSHNNAGDAALKCSDMRTKIPETLFLIEFCFVS